MINLISFSSVTFPVQEQQVPSLKDTECNDLPFQALCASLTSPVTAFQLFLHVTFYLNVPNSKYLYFSVLPFRCENLFQPLCDSYQHPGEDAHPSKKPFLINSIYIFLHDCIYFEFLLSFQLIDIQYYVSFRCTAQ